MLMIQKVYVGLSGGVDSSVTAALLKEQGYEVTGVYMKNWSQDLPGFTCPWKEDFQDAKRVAVQLGIPFKMFDFEKEYRQKVVDYMVAEYQAGRTPNPDVMCNQEVKFKLFLETCMEDGADLIATGHYARVATSNQQLENSRESGTADPKLATHLLRAEDDNKDQTYFLYRVTEKALEKTLFPLGGYTKPEVRALAQKYGLVTAKKKESMGICFVGKVGIKEFLLYELGPQKSGKIIDQAGVVMGEHDGAIFYTIGQRHGLDVGGGLPFYVVGKDMKKNEVYVTTDLNDERLWHEELTLTSLHWINGEPSTDKTYQVRTRHRAELIDCTIGLATGPDGCSAVRVELASAIRALTPGQSAVLYDGKVVLGGGIIT
jgi:tRNA-specific 2-thiouridylase